MAYESATYIYIYKFGLYNPWGYKSYIYHPLGTTTRLKPPLPNGLNLRPSSMAWLGEVEV